MIHLRLLSSAEIQTPLGRVTPSQEIAFAAALYLMIERERPTSRARLAGLLWPSAPPRVRSHRLRQTLLQLKRLGIDLTATRDTVQIPIGGISIDAEGEPPLSQDAWPTPTHIEILPGYDPLFSTEFGEWLDIAKQRVQVALLERLVPKLERVRAAGDWVNANLLATYCLDLDPFNEIAVLTRAEAFAMRGQKNVALDVLDRYLEAVAPRNPHVVVPAKILRNRVSKYTPTAATQLSSREPHWVGRQAEMLSLTTQLGNSREGRGSACLITGDAGIGKTRLASELAKFAALQGVRVEAIKCRKPEAN